MSRLSRLAALMLLAAPLATPALAGDLVERGGVPLVSSTTLNATNTAAGIGNVAEQRINRIGGSGYGYGPLVKDTTVDATNTAAGIGNFAGQRISRVGSGSGYGFSPLVKSTTVDATNTAAGIANFAGQSIRNVR